MELIREEKNKKIFAEGNNKIYSMINMGDYVGHKYRRWYDSKPEVWKLMFYDEKRDDGKELHIEALVDDNGNYIRIIVELEKLNRVFLIQNGRVFSDTIIEILDIKDGLFGDQFVALDENAYAEGNLLLEDYLLLNPTFRMNDQIYNGELSKNSFISEFLNKNDELNETLEYNKTI